MAVLSVASVLANTAKASANTPPRTAAKYPSGASDAERRTLDRLASEIQGAVVYTKSGRVKKVVLGDWRSVDLGAGDYVRWGPLGRRIAVLHRGTVYVMNADGSVRRKLVGDVERGGIEFHTNGREILYCRRRKGVWAVDIASGKRRNLNLPFETELGISADGRHLVGRRNDCYTVELPGTKCRKYSGGCAPCVSPDGQRVTSNNGDHKTMNIQDWNGKRLFKISAGSIRPDREWDNQHWSNHNDFITVEGDGKRREAYVFRVSKNEGTRVSWEGRVSYPDLFVAKDLETGRSPMELTVAWAGRKLNYPPSVHTGNDQTVMLPRNGKEVTVSLTGSVADDGKSGPVTSTWSAGNGPGKVRFAEANKPQTNVILTRAGDYVLTLTASDGKLTTSDTVKITVEPFSPRVTKTYNPLTDAFIEGSKAKATQQLKVEHNRRVAYLKFKVTGLPAGASILRATLRLTENGDTGSGTLRFAGAANNNWSANTLTASRVPANKKPAASWAGSVDDGESIEVDVTSLVTGNGDHTIVVTMDRGGNDISFGSSRSSAKPLLTVTALERQ
jgi:hypothetical protein